MEVKLRSSNLELRIRCCDHLRLELKYNWCATHSNNIANRRRNHPNIRMRLYLPYFILETHRAIRLNEDFLLKSLTNVDSVQINYSWHELIL